MKQSVNQSSAILLIAADQFQPGDVVLYFGELYVQAQPEPHASYTAVAVEGLDGPSVVQYFQPGKYKVRRPGVAPAGISMADARKSEREWMARNLAWTAAQS